MAHVFEKKWRSQDVRLRENVDFSALLLSDRVIKGLKKAGFRKPSPIQLEAIPMGKFGKDMMVQAKSGTGKTLVFSIIALEMLKPKLFRPQVLIIVPTREIATQVCSVIKTIGSAFHKMTCNSFIGGLPLFEDQEKAVMTQIVVGTPGRLRQLIQLKSLPTNSIRLLIFDEADELLHSNSFKDDIEDIFNALPDEKQVIATSATYNPKVKKMMYRYLCDPHLIRLNAKHLALLGMVHYAVTVDFCPMPIILYRHKLEVLEKILKTVKFAQCLLFCNGIQKVEVLYKDVKRFGFSAAYISSAKEQCDRLKAMERLKRFKCKVLVSSDLTARGIDAENVDLVINFDLSYTSEVYMHRVGRAGRYGSIGVAISIIDNQEIRHLQRIEKEGSFKTFKLPDPIPKDLILYPPEAEFVIDEPELKNVDSSKAKILKSNIIKCDVLNDCDHDMKGEALNGNSYDSEKEVNAKNIKIDTIPETSVYIVNNSSENVLSEQIADDDRKSCDNIEHALECEMEDEKGDQDDIAYLKSENKIIHHIEHSANTNLQHEHTGDDDIKLGKNKNLYLLSDSDPNELIINDSSDKPYVCDTYEKPDFCDKNELEKQEIIKDDIKNDYSVIEKNDFETGDRKLNDTDLDNVPQSSDQKDIEKMLKDGSIDNLFKSSEPEKIAKNTKDDLKCAVESMVEFPGKVINMTKMFLDAHEKELKRRLESTKSKIAVDTNCQLMEDSGKKLITIDMINNLQFQKHEFFYKTFKKFQENKDGNSDGSKIEKEDEGKSNEHDSKLDLVIEEINATHAKLAEKPEFESKNIFPENFAFESTSQVNEENIAVHTNLVETSEFGSKTYFPEKPTFESTPQVNDKIKKDAAKIPTDDVCKPNSQNKLSQLFQEFSDDTYSDDSASSEEISEIAKQSSTVDSKSHTSVSDSGSVSSSSDSSSVSPSSDSEEDSDSETDSSSFSSSESSSDSSSSTTATSLNEDEESIYRHNYSRTGRQNPSLISGSVRSQIVNDQNYYDTCFQNHKCFCCGAAMKERMPGRRRKQCSRIPNDNASACLRNVDCNSSLFDHRENSYSSGVCPSGNRRLQNFPRCSNVTQFYSPRGHSMCHRSRNPTSIISRGRRYQNTVECPIFQRSSSHQHTLSCFMPTEHRCHPNTPDYPCKQGQLCEIWYNTFYQQWLHIQNVIN